MSRKFEIKSMNLKFEIPDRCNNVFIVGADTYLGTHFAKYWLEENRNVYGCGTAKVLSEDLKQVHYSQSDFASWDFADKSFDWFMICLTPAMNTISYLTALKSFCDYIDQNQLSPHVCFPSSFMICESKSHKSISEECILDPHSEYEMNLAMAEQYLNMRSCHLETNLLPYVVRLGEVYGDEIQRDDATILPGMINSAWQAAIAGEPITMYGLGEKKRTFTHIADACRFVIEYLKLDFAPRKVNVPGEKMRLVEAIMAMAVQYDVETPLAAATQNNVFFNKFAGDQVLSEALAKKLIAYEPRFNFKRWLSAQEPKTAALAIG